MSYDNIVYVIKNLNVVLIIVFSDDLIYIFK